jgi:dual specificity MAP kinase phosphatase
MAPSLNLDACIQNASYPIAIPNKHIPVCPTGPAPSNQPDTPPASPPTKNIELSAGSILFPTAAFSLHSIATAETPVYAIDAKGVATSLDYLSTQPLPDPSQLFPWLHGLHENNVAQQAFFVARRRVLRRTPKCYRGITIVKQGGDLGRCRLKGAIAPEEILQYEDNKASGFIDIDPAEGFSVRNFHIQTAKMAMLSDIIVYGQDLLELETLALDISSAQRAWREKNRAQGQEIPEYNVFICTDNFEVFEDKHPEIVAMNAKGEMTGEVMDFFYRERVEMCTMTAASEISHNVWLGPTPDSAIDPSLLAEGTADYDVFIECSDMGRMNPAILQSIHDGTFLTEVDGEEAPAYLEFPSSGSIMPPSWSQTEADGILETCKWIHALANGLPAPETDYEGDTPMPSSPAKEHKILIHCTDGYTESTLLALSYFIFATGQPLHSAWVDLHTTYGRNFFAYPSDVALLQSIAPRLLTNSPALPSASLSDITALIRSEPAWLRNMDGSLPSRILPHMYLGNLGHANNPGLLKELGIGQILSVGEMYNWTQEEVDAWGLENICVVRGVQDNGVDPLNGELERGLAFIGKF